VRISFITAKPRNLANQVGSGGAMQANPAVSQ